MEYFKSTNVQINHLSLKRDETITNVPFDEYSHTTASYYMVSSSFYGAFPLETVQNQTLVLNTSSIIVYQPPLNMRGDSIVPSTIEITTDNFNLIDDGNGNLFDDFNLTFVGNVFYNTGLFVISNLDYNELLNGNSTIFYKRFANFIENKYIVDIEEKKYTFSINPTFKDSDAQNPFLTKILLYNSLNEVIAVGTLNRPVELDTNITIILDLIQT